MIDRNKLTAFKHALQNDIIKRFGGYCEVQIQQMSTSKLEELFLLTVIPNGELFNIQRFEVYQDRKGNIYWDRHVGYQERQFEKNI